MIETAITAQGLGEVSEAGPTTWGFDGAGNIDGAHAKEPYTPLKRDRNKIKRDLLTPNEPY